MQSTLRQATDPVRVKVGDAIHLEPRDFLAVHMKSGEPCPRCGAPISLVGANQRITNFCRTCQPGGLIKGMEHAGTRNESTRSVDSLIFTAARALFQTFPSIFSTRAISPSTATRNVSTGFFAGPRTTSPVFTLNREP